MTINTLFGKRFYLLIILVLKSRKIVRYDLTEYTTREFVKQRIQLFSENQVRKIIQSYVKYYNYQRSHQGVGRIPNGEIVSRTGKIEKEPILGGLRHHYYRSNA